MMLANKTEHAHKVSTEDLLNFSSLFSVMVKAVSNVLNLAEMSLCTQDLGISNDVISSHCLPSLLIVWLAFLLFKYGNTIWKMVTICLLPLLWHHQP